MSINRKSIRKRIHKRVRRKISGTSQRPRLAVHYSNQHIYAQIIDDEAGATICSASTLNKEVTTKASNEAAAVQVGALIAKKAKDSKIDTLVFDRGGHSYHGKVKALAEAVREGGIKF